MIMPNHAKDAAKIARRTLKGWPSLTTLLAFAAAAPTSHAAETESPAALDEVVVTAQKREQRAQDVGITLNAFSSETLIRMGAVDAPDIAKLTPGVNIAGSFAGQNVTFSIRGVTQQDFNAQAESPVAVYLDDGYLAMNNVAAVGLFDVERVEVLKGPQGTLFGRNATGGLVSITTRRPTKELEAYATAEFGSYSSQKYEAAIGGPLSDRIQGRLAVGYNSNDGWVENSNPTGGDLGGQRTKQIRGQLAVQPTDHLDLLFTGYYSDTEQSWGPYLVLSTRSTINNGIPNAIVVNQPTAFFGADPFTGLPYAPQPASDAEHLRVDANSAQSTGGYNTLGGGTLHVNWDLGGAQLTSISDYKKSRYFLPLDDDATAQTYFNTQTRAAVENYSEELRLFKDFGHDRLTTGAYYLHINARETDLQQPFFLGVQVSSPFALQANSYSLFSQDEHSLSDQWSIVAGGRLTREQKDFHYDGNAETVQGAFLGDLRSYRGSLAETLWSGKLQLEYRPTRDLLIYAGYNRGTKAGNFNAPFAGGATPADPEIPYHPEKLNAYEIGEKGTFLDGRATVNASVYYYDYKDYQAFKFVNLATVVTNNPAKTKGVELDINGRPVKGLELMLGASYTDSKVYDVGISNSLGSAVVTRVPPYFTKFRGIASARYEIPTTVGSFSLQADVQSQSGSFISLTNFDATEINPYTLVNSRLSWQSVDQHWEIAAWGRNITDKRYKTVGFEASDFGGWTQMGYGRPRWFGVTLTARY